MLLLLGTMLTDRVESHAVFPSRLHLCPGSFFEKDSIPKGHDVYILKYILHDWDDERALQILKNVKGAMVAEQSQEQQQQQQQQHSPHSHKRILVIEHVLPADNSGQPLYGYLLDMVMLTLTDNGKERTITEYEKLCEAAGLRVVTVHKSAQVSASDFHNLNVLEVALCDP